MKTFIQMPSDEKEVLKTYLYNRGKCRIKPLISHFYMDSLKKPKQIDHSWVNGHRPRSDPEGIKCEVTDDDIRRYKRLRKKMSKLRQ